MKQAKELSEISSENAVIDHEIETIEFQLEEAANAGCFKRILILDHKELMELRELGYRVDFSHVHQIKSSNSSNVINRKYYEVSW